MDDEFDESEIRSDDAVSDEAENSVNAENAKEEKSISSDLIRGHINTIILRSLSDSDKYGYEIIAEIEKKSLGQYSLKQPSLYSALKRLETQGFVTSYWGGTAGGGRRKYFSLTEDGKAIADQNRSEWEYSRTIIDSLISDKDFDFSNPAPSAVNMRVLKETTSRVPSREGRGEDDEAEDDRLQELEARYNELLAENERVREELSESREREEYYRSEGFTSSDSELDEEERARYQSIIRGRDEIISNLNSRYEELLEQEKTQLADKERERYEAMLSEERERAEREQEELKKRYEELIRREDGMLLAEEERERYEEIIRDREARLESVQARYNEHLESNAYLSEDERERYEELLKEQRERLEEEAARYRRELDEQAALFREREKEIRHQNYINLINTPPPMQEPENEDFDHYTPPRVDEVAEESEPQAAEAVGDYRTVVNRLYASSIRTDASPAEIREESADARSIDGIDFHDIETKAAKDGIRIITSGKTEKTEKRASDSVVHKGKALFLSALLLFFIIVAEGAIVIGLKGKYGIPIAYPCILWGIGLVILLVTGLAYANHYGERSLRKPTPVLINTIVLYIVAVIVALIVALGVNIDFRSAKAVACFVVIPVIYLFGIVVFGITYYMQIKPKK